MKKRHNFLLRVLIIAILSISFSYTSQDTAYADAASECTKLGYSGDTHKGCVYGYDNVTGTSADGIRDKCRAGGHTRDASDLTGCSVGARLQGNKNIGGDDAKAACESVGYYGSYLDNCIKSYEQNKGKTDEEIEKACGGKGTTCYAAGQLANNQAPPLDPKKIGNKADCDAANQGYVWYNGRCQPPSDLTNEYDCKAAGMEFKMTQAGTGGSPDTWTCVNPNDPSTDPTKNPTGNKSCGDDDFKVETSIIDCQGKTGAEAIGSILKQFVVILSAGVGILAVAGILYGAVLYASAQDNASQTKKAVEIITNTALGLLLYMFMIAILNWLVPGGVITG